LTFAPYTDGPTGSNGGVAGPPSSDPSVPPPPSEPGSIATGGVSDGWLLHEESKAKQAPAQTFQSFMAAS
jgi:hypothetical protein